MNKLVVTGKTGFRINSNYLHVPVIIRDWRGVLFYSTEELTPRTKEFNLPDLTEPTTYYVESGYFSAMEKPVDFNEIRLPKPERNFPDPSKFKMVFANNPHKCSISWFKKEIVFDNSFKEKPLPELYFVKYHEFAHRYYETEKYVDLLATNYMLRKGFNPSQIGRAHALSLSDKQHYRKVYNIEKIIESNGKRIN